MLDAFKDYLGLGPVRLGIVVDDDQTTPTRIGGQVFLTSKRALTLTGLTLRLTEQTRRGWGDERTREARQLGQIAVSLDLAVAAGEEVRVPWTLNYVRSRGPLHRAAAYFAPAKPLARAQDLATRTRVSCHLEARADVLGARAQPKRRIAVALP